MLRKLQLCALLIAWLFATGAQWDVAQLWAWGSMIANYSRTMAVTEAVKLTFEPTTMCTVCKAVAAAKKRETATPAVAAGVGKVLLVFQPAPTVVVAPSSRERWTAAEVLIRDETRAAPPTPPPRAV